MKMRIGFRVPSMMAIASLALAGCGGSKTANDPSSGESNQAWTSETGGANAGAAAAAAGGPTWTKYDDPAAGLQVEMPCAKPTVSVKPGVAGPMQYTQKELTCSVGASKYTLEYWTQMNMDMSKFNQANMANVKALVEPVVMSWVDSPKRDGYAITEKGAINSMPGWAAFEVRGTKGADVRADRHYLLLPRHIATTASGPSADSAQHERFNGSIRIVEVGTAATAANEGKEASTSDRTIDLNGAKFSVALPCTPAFKPDLIDQTPDGPMRTREFECRHPSANQGFIGSVGRIEKPLALSANVKKTKNAQLVNDNAQVLCDGMKAQIPGTKCKVGSPRPYGTNGAESLVESDGMTVRVIFDLPYMAMVGVVAPAAVPEKARILASLKPPPAP